MCKMFTKNTFHVRLTNRSTDLKPRVVIMGTEKNESPWRGTAIVPTATVIARTCVVSVGRQWVARDDSRIPLRNEILWSCSSFKNRNQLIQFLLRFIELGRRNSPSSPPPYYVEVLAMSKRSSHCHETDKIDGTAQVLSDKTVITTITSGSV